MGATFDPFQVANNASLLQRSLGQLLGLNEIKSYLLGLPWQPIGVVDLNLPVWDVRSCASVCILVRRAH